jgi:hypothetical protein
MLATTAASEPEPPTSPTSPGHGPAHPVKSTRAPPTPGSLTVLRFDGVPSTPWPRHVPLLQVRRRPRCRHVHRPIGHDRPSASGPGDGGPIGMSDKALGVTPCQAGATSSARRYTCREVVSWPAATTQWVPCSEHGEPISTASHNRQWWRCKPPLPYATPTGQWMVDAVA